MKLKRWKIKFEIVLGFGGIEIQLYLLENYADPSHPYLLKNYKANASDHNFFSKYFNTACFFFHKLYDIYSERDSFLLRNGSTL